MMTFQWLYDLTGRHKEASDWLVHCFSIFVPPDCVCCYFKDQGREWDEHNLILTWWAHDGACTLMSGPWVSHFGFSGRNDVSGKPEICGGALSHRRPLLATWGRQLFTILFLIERPGQVVVAFFTVRRSFISHSFTERIDTRVVNRSMH